MRYPILESPARYGHFSARVRWMTWDPAQPQQIIGLALFGPTASVQGLQASFLHSTFPFLTWRWDANNPPPTHPASAPLPPSGNELIRAILPESFRITSTALPLSMKRPWLQSVLLPESVFTAPPLDLTQAFFAIHWGDPDQWTHTAWRVLQTLPFPLLDAWREPFFAFLAAHSDPDGPDILPLPFWAAHPSFAPTVIRFVHLDTLPDFVSHLVREQILVIPDGPGPNPAPSKDLDTAYSPDAYLQAWAPALAQQLDTIVVPRHPAGTASLDAYSSWLRLPRSAQADVIQAASLTVNETGRCLIVGEPGTGKTLMMLGVPWDLFIRHQHRAGYRVLVVVPDHLVPKWHREIRETLPDARTYTVDSWRTVLQLRAAWQHPATTPEYWIIGRDRAKLSYRTHFAARWSDRHGGWTCPDCGHLLTDPITSAPWPKTVSKTMKTRHCPVCHTPLWAADPALRRISPMHLLRRYARHRFDMAIIDEVHELKGDTEQGQVLAWAGSVARTLIAGTGTLASGYADDLHLLQWRLDPASMVRDDLPHANSTLTLKRYGRIRETYRYITRSDLDTDADRMMGRHTHTKKTTKRLPGISPLWYATKLVDKTVFITLEDLGANALPPYTETVRWVTMADDQAQWVHNAVSRLRDVAEAAMRRGSRHYLGQLVATALTLPDEPWRSLVLDDVEYTSGNEALTPDRIYPKEQALLEDVLAEHQRGRKVWIYTPYTKTHPQADRLANLLRAHHLTVAILTDTVPRDQREAWVQHQVQHGVDVVISHPQLVETGLDLFAFPTILWYTTGYNLFRLRQASRRAWRLGQHQPCEVRFYAYQDTMQESALVLMAQKLDIAKALEGQLSLEGLQSLNTESSDIDLARVLVNGLDTIPDVSAIWQTAADPVLATLSPSEPMASTPTAPPAPSQVVSWATLTAARRSRRKAPARPENQLSWGF